MPLARSLGIATDSARARILSETDPGDFAWSIPIMRAGYAGRGLVYLVVAGVSLWSIFRGGEAQGTGEAFAALDGGFGTLVLVLIALGMFAYAVWRAVDSFWDLEAYGTDGEGIVARLGMLVTGAAHLGIGILALTLLFSRGDSGGGGQMLDQIMQAPLGRWAVGIAGLLTLGAGGYYIVKAWREDYRKHLKANHFTTNWNLALKAGLAAQGVTIGIIGLLILYAALGASPDEAGGVGSAFEWLYAQPYGRILVTVLCLGLLAFALFCFVNAVWRVIPKAASDDIETVAARVAAKAKRAVGA